LPTEKQVGKLLALTEEGDSGREECDGKGKMACTKVKGSI
jgi:hypothetical protein